MESQEPMGAPATVTKDQLSVLFSKLPFAIKSPESGGCEIPQLLNKLLLTDVAEAMYPVCWKLCWDRGQEAFPLSIKGRNKTDKSAKNMIEADRRYTLSTSVLNCSLLPYLLFAG